MGDIKTNAMRILDQKKIPYQTHFYDPNGKIDGVSVAEKMGQAKERVFKTLVTVGKSRNYYVFLVPVAQELNLKQVAKSVGEKSVEMIPVKDINKVTGYIRGGCSPVGMKEQFKTVVHETARDFSYIIVSGGKIGCQIEITPKDLETITGCHYDFIVIG